MTNEPTTRASEGTAQEVFWARPQGALVGLSTDTKPTTDDKGAPLAAGTRWRDRDGNKNEYEWSGTAWILSAPDTSAAVTAAKAAEIADGARELILLSAVLTELRGIRTLLANAQNISESTFEALPKTSERGN